MNRVGGRAAPRLHFALAASLVLGCGGERAIQEKVVAGESAAESVVQDAGSGYRAIEVTDGGAIEGVVRLVGTPPPPRLIEVDQDVEACGSTQEVRTFRVGPSNGLADVVVSLTDVTEGAALVAPTEPLALDQTGCRFAPHVLLVPPGSPAQILNSDPVTHNIHTLAFNNRPINRAQPTYVKKLEVSFSAPEKVKVNCDIHEWMGAWIVVMGHPYYAVTGQNGRFTITNIPPGTYTLEIWHEKLGAQSREVSVRAGETTELSFELSPQA